MKISVLSNLMMRYGSQLGMTDREQVIYWHLMDYDHNGKKASWPGQKTIGARKNIKTRKGVSAITKSLEQKKLLTIIRTPGKGNRYEFQLLIQKLIPFYENEVQREREKNESTVAESIHQTVTSEQKSIPQIVHTDETTIHQVVTGEQDSMHQMVTTFDATRHQVVTSLAQNLRNPSPNGNTNSSIFPPIDNLEIERGGRLKAKSENYWELLQPVREWWDNKAIPAYRKKYGWEPGALVGGPMLEDLLKHAKVFGMEVLEIKYEDYLRQTKPFFTKDNHPLGLFVKCIAQFSGSRNNANDRGYESENTRESVDAFIKKMEARNRQMIAA